MKKILAAWNLKMIHEALNIHRHLANAGKTWEDVEQYIADSAGNKGHKAIAASGRRQAVIHVCPQCGRLMQLYSVNSDPQKRDRVISEKGSDYKSMWLCGTTCSGKGCLHEEYSVLTVQEEIERNKAKGWNTEA